MRDFVGYFGCTAIFIVMMGVVFHTLVWPTLKHRKKPFLEWVVIAVFGFGMLRSMAVTPGVDSDGDGIPNDQELNDLGTDPWLADSDGDGVPDLDELIAGTNPPVLLAHRGWWRRSIYNVLCMRNPECNG